MDILSYIKGKKISTFLICILLFLLSSCLPFANSTLIRIESNPIVFSKIDPNNLQFEKYDEILSSSPIPVYIINVSDFAFEFLYYFLDDGDPNVLRKSTIFDINMLGMYVHNHKVKGWPNEFIYINKALTPTQIMVVYGHEIGHYKCRKKHCICFHITNPLLKETHALLNELEFAWKHNFPEVMESSVRIMAAQILDEDTDLHNKMAVALVIDYEIWDKTIKYLIKLESEKIR